MLGWALLACDGGTVEVPRTTDTAPPTVPEPTVPEPAWIVRDGDAVTLENLDVHGSGTLTRVPAAK